MLELIITRGLPASGKSTWAKTHVISDGWKRVNKDDLRAMMDCSVYSKSNEKLVLATRDFIIKEALKRGRTVVCDDTNLSPRMMQQFEDIVYEHNSIYGITDDQKVRLVIIDTFLNEDIETCIERDAQRTGTANVGKGVILRMAEDFYQWYGEELPGYRSPNANK